MRPCTSTTPLSTSTVVARGSMCRLARVPDPLPRRAMMSPPGTRTVTSAPVARSDALPRLVSTRAPSSPAGATTSSAAPFTSARSSPRLTASVPPRGTLTAVPATSWCSPLVSAVHFVSPGARARAGLPLTWAVASPLCGSTGGPASAVATTGPASAVATTGPASATSVFLLFTRSSFDPPSSKSSASPAVSSCFTWLRVTTARPTSTSKRVAPPSDPMCTLLPAAMLAVPISSSSTASSSASSSPSTATLPGPNRMVVAGPIFRLPPDRKCRRAPPSFEVLTE
jgi:hypothetical protein